MALTAGLAYRVVHRAALWKAGERPKLNSG